MKKINFTKFMIIFALMISQSVIAKEDDLCPYLHNFLQSIDIDKNATISLHTSWGSNFNDDTEDVFAAKRCVHNNVAAAKLLCDYLMPNSSTEFPGINFKRFLLCLSPKTKIDTSVQFSSGSVSLSYGTDDRGTLINLSLEEDKNIGGMVLKIEAEGY